MAIKKITASSDTGKSLLVTIIDETTGNILDDTDGVFRTETACVDDLIALTEHLIANGFDSDIPGLYALSENRAAWLDGDKTLLFREDGSNNVIGSDQMRTGGDVDVLVKFDDHTS